MWATCIYYSCMPENYEKVWGDYVPVSDCNNVLFFCVDCADYWSVYIYDIKVWCNLIVVDLMKKNIYQCTLHLNLQF